MNNSLYERVKNKEDKIALIGLGYVGMPIAVAFAKKANVIGFDVSESLVNVLTELREAYRS